MNRETTCLLCGETSHDVRPRVVAWREQLHGSEYQVIPRCSRTHECRERVLLQGEEWLVREPIDIVAIRTRVGPPLDIAEALRNG